jgi:hypothetical protein
LKHLNGIYFFRTEDGHHGGSHGKHKRNSGQLSPADLAAQVKPEILREWQGHPIMRLLTINSITLMHQGGDDYSGTVECRFLDQMLKAPIEVKVDGAKVRWQFRPGDEGMLICEMGFKGARVFRVHPITDDEAMHFGEAPAQEGIFTDEPAVCLQTRVEGVYQVRLMVKDGVADDAAALETFRQIGAALATNVFDGPVIVILCDDKLATLAVIAP